MGGFDKAVRRVDVTFRAFSIVELPCIDPSFPLSWVVPAVTHASAAWLVLQPVAGTKPPQIMPMNAAALPRLIQVNVHSLTGHHHVQFITSLARKTLPGIFWMGYSIRLVVISVSTAFQPLMTSHPIISGRSHVAKRQEWPVRSQRQAYDGPWSRAAIGLFPKRATLADGLGGQGSSLRVDTSPR